MVRARLAAGQAEWLAELRRVTSLFLNLLDADPAAADQLEPLQLIGGAEQAAPQVIVTDIRMPPTYRHEEINAANQVRKRHPGTGMVVLFPVRRPGVRHLPARRGRRRLCLPAQGPRGRAD